MAHRMPDAVHSALVHTRTSVYLRTTPSVQEGFGFQSCEPIISPFYLYRVFLRPARSRRLRPHSCCDME